MFEIGFYRDQNTWEHKQIPIEFSKNDSDKNIEMLTYKNHYVLIKKFNVFLDNDNCTYNCRSRLNSYTCQNILIKHKEKCEQKQEITTIRTSDESHLHWKKYFHKSPIYIRIIADFEADKGIDNTNISNKTFNSYEQNPVPKCYYMVSELDDILKSGNYEHSLGYNDVDWYVYEVIK